MIPLICQWFSQLIGFQISSAKCGRGHNHEMAQWPNFRHDKVSQGSLCFVLGQETSRSKSFFLSGVLRRIQYRHR